MGLVPSKKAKNKANSRKDVTDGGPANEEEELKAAQKTNEVWYLNEVSYIGHPLGHINGLLFAPLQSKVEYGAAVSSSKKAIKCKRRKEFASEKVSGSEGKRNIVINGAPGKTNINEYKKYKKEDNKSMKRKKKKKKTRSDGV